MYQLVRGSGFLNWILLGLTVLALQACVHKYVPTDEEDEEQVKQTWEQRFIQGDLAVSRWFYGAAEELDLLMVGKKVTDQQNESNVKIENSTYSTEGKPLSNVTSFSINPRFPNLEKFWQLKFTSYDERQDSRSVNSSYLRQSPREQNYGATIGLFQKLGNIRTAFQPRIELQDPLKVSHSLSFESVADFKKFQFNPKFEFFADASKGTGIYQSYNLNFYLSKIFSLTIINEGEYEERIHKLSTSNGLSLGQFLTPKRTMTYSLIFNSNNRPSYMLESYTIAATLNQLIYRKILDFQMTPHVDFPYELGFKGVAGLTFTVNLLF